MSELFWTVSFYLSRIWINTFIGNNISITISIVIYYVKSMTIFLSISRFYINIDEHLPSNIYT